MIIRAEGPLLRWKQTGRFSRFTVGAAAIMVDDEMVALIREHYEVANRVGDLPEIARACLLKGATSSSLKVRTDALRLLRDAASKRPQRHARVAGRRR